MRKFEVPGTYKSGIIGKIKELRKNLDPRKKDFTPGILDFGNVRFILPRHFGFCYGVENAIEISFRAVKENPGKKIFLLSEMIHNPSVNQDLLDLGIRFIMDTKGNNLVPWSEINPGDIVIIPAFGTTLEIEKLLQDRGVEIQQYNTTCPFVEKVWKRSAEIGVKGFTTVIHGKHYHEETRATFSHSIQHNAAIVIRDMKEARQLEKYIRKQGTVAEFETEFAGKYSVGFDPYKDLDRIGVVNQTTMLATETLEISEFLKKVMMDLYGETWTPHFADTRDTLCYATNDNQEATQALSKVKADLGIVIGGYNSSNTMQLVHILSGQMPVYFIVGKEEILSKELIRHFSLETNSVQETKNWFPSHNPVTILLTSGASCPDNLVEDVMKRILSFYDGEKDFEKAIDNFSLIATT